MYTYNVYKMTKLYPSQSDPIIKTVTATQFEVSEIVRELNFKNLGERYYYIRVSEYIKDN
ncbi:MAG: hypothetical protein II264_03230 [Ruminococcus sp.]|nr:hypothetical protein [Ruminococcus sp.]